jgi:hypothetical protein
LEPLLHFSIPLASLLLLGLKPREAFPLAFLGIVPDLDALLHVHRSLSHSFLFYIAVVLPPLLYSWYAGRGWEYHLVLAFAVLSSHSLMDLFSGYTPVLWPLMKNSYRINAGLNGHIGTGVSISGIWRLDNQPTEFTRFHTVDYPIFTSQGIITSVILLLPVAVNIIKEYRARI